MAATMCLPGPVPSRSFYGGGGELGNRSVGHWVDKSLDIGEEVRLFWDGPWEYYGDAVVSLTSTAGNLRSSRDSTHSRNLIKLNILPLEW